MDGSSDAPAGDEPVQVGAFPGGLTAGSTVLVATAGDPTRDAVGFRILCRYGTAGDTALVVTTGESVDPTIETFDRLCPDGERPSLGLVDTTSAEQSVSALYGGTPVVFTPSPGDLERLILALSELSGNAPPATGARHLLVRSLTPVLETASTARVCTVLDRITGIRSEAGLCLLGLDYTAHDEETMTALAGQVDGVLWVTRSPGDRLEFEYRPTSGRHGRAVARSDVDD